MSRSNRKSRDSHLSYDWSNMSICPAYRQRTDCQLEQARPRIICSTADVILQSQPTFQLSLTLQQHNSQSACNTRASRHPPQQLCGYLSRYILQCPSSLAAQLVLAALPNESRSIKHNLTKLADGYGEKLVLIGVIDISCISLLVNCYSRATNCNERGRTTTIIPPATYTLIRKQATNEVSPSIQFTLHQSPQSTGNQPLPVFPFTLI
jgi:hypothetical protein